MSDKKVPHVHAECIKAWADGYPIQVSVAGQRWYDIADGEKPGWSEDCLYRVKPEPKPDVVQYGVAKLLDDGTAKVYYLGVRNYTIGQNIELTFDGETGELKDARALKMGES